MIYHVSAAPYYLCSGEGGLDVAEDGVQVGADQAQRADANEGNEAENQAVFREALAAVIRKNGLNFVKHL
jgi:hypothetical protein